MKRLLTIVAAAALAIGVSLPAAAFSRPASNVSSLEATPGAAADNEQGLAVAVAAPALVERDGYSAEPKPPPQPVYASGTYLGPVPDVFLGMFQFWPVPGGRLGDGFGWRTDGSGEWHPGIDVLAPGGTPIVAVAAGTVIVVQDDPNNSGYGAYVEIAHGQGVTTLYAHMPGGAPSQFVTPGQFVEAGQQIGIVGQTGYATTTHCHMEVAIGGAKTDPIPFFAPGTH